MKTSTNPQMMAFSKLRANRTRAMRDHVMIVVVMFCATLLIGVAGIAA